MATRVEHDAQTDLSVLFTDHTDLNYARVGDSSQVEIGDFVVAVGSPFGLSHSVSYGIISAKGRRDLELGPQGGGRVRGRTQPPSGVSNTSPASANA